MLPELTRRALLASGLFALAVSLLLPAARADEQHYLLVAAPGVRNYLEYGGHGLLVFDADRDHRFIKRIPLAGLDEAGKPINVKGICGSAATGRIYISTIRSLMCIDFASEKLLWEKAYPGGCDRMSMTPDGKRIYLPSFEGDHWHVVDQDGEIVAKIEPKSGAHNTIVSLDGREAYLAGLRSPLLSIVDTSHNQIVRTVGPFAASIRPFTVDSRRERCYVCINDLIGFEVGDLSTGQKLWRVEVAGYEKGPVKRHGCPSHGIGLTPDESELWVVDAFNQSVHIFDPHAQPPKQLASIRLADEPGWVTFSPDGKFAYPSTGQVIDVATRKVLWQLTDETGARVQSEKMLPVTVRDGRLIGVADQFGLGRAATNR
jgi:DNA-binding beta-propeller fold protein YncE